MYAFTPSIKGTTSKSDVMHAQLVATFRSSVASALAQIEQSAMEVMTAGYDSYGDPVISADDEQFIQAFLGRLRDLQALV